MFKSIFHGKTVIVTGHTGFKGSWLSAWLKTLGANVVGIALDSPTQPSHFSALNLASTINSFIIDIRDDLAVRGAFVEAKPDFVFHLAAQALVRRSYEAPLETWETNVLGTLHVLEALRKLDKPCATVIITSDKCYDNVEWVWGYRESDPMGGPDPYSASKGAAELAIRSHIKSYFPKGSSKVRIASARAGNVIGGGDWAPDRIVPDCIKALQNGGAIPVRNKVATRPWQHVLEPLSGYLQLAGWLDSEPGLNPFPAELYQSGFNFGPALESNRTVSDLVGEILRHWPGNWEDHSDPNAPHEAVKLNLATDKAFHLLNWQPRWGFAETVEKTISWYKAAADLHSPAGFQSLTQTQLSAYSERRKPGAQVFLQQMEANP